MKKRKIWKYKLKKKTGRSRRRREGKRGRKGRNDGSHIENG
jgi:hypothetical protein